MGLTDDTVQEIVDACLSMVGLPYDGEPVDQLEHALQAPTISWTVSSVSPMAACRAW